METAAKIRQNQTYQKQKLFLCILTPDRLNMAKLCDHWEHPELEECWVWELCQRIVLEKDNFYLGRIRFGWKVFYFGSREPVLILQHFRFCDQRFLRCIFSLCLKNSISALEITFTVFISLYCEGKTSKAPFFYYWIKNKRHIDFMVSDKHLRGFMWGILMYFTLWVSSLKGWFKLFEVGSYEVSIGSVLYCIQ